MKRKLLFMMLCIVGALVGKAQTDVTSKITNADFSSTDGWTNEHSANYYSFGSGLIGTYAVANNKTSTTDDTHLATEYCLGLQCRWSTNYSNATQTLANLEAGVYTLTYDVENTNASNSATYDNNFKVTVGETTYTDSKTEWMNGQSGWTTHSITFTLTEAADATISFGYGTGSNNLGSGYTPHIYVSHLSLSYSNSIPATAVSLTPTSLSLSVGGTGTLTPVFTPENANSQTGITWTTSNSAVATVTNGVVYATGPGEATITATTEGGLTATATVTVTDVEAADVPAYYSTELVGDTDYYLYNAGTGKFLGGANDWGTHASIIEHGIPFKLTKISDGVYTLDSYVSNGGNNHYVAGSYIDGAATNLYVTALENGTFSISTAENSAYMTAYSTGTYVNNDASSANSVLAQWYFLSKEDRDKVLAEATSANPADATYYIDDANFGRNNQKYSSWNLTEGTTANVAVAGDNDNFNWQKWNGIFDFNQELSGLPNGLYELRAQGFYRPGANNTNPASGNAYLYAGDAQTEIAWVSSSNATSADASKGLTTANTNTENTYYVPNSQSDASKAFNAGLYNNIVSNISVTDGTLTIGAKTSETTGNQWTVIDNFELYYIGPTIASEAVELPETAMESGKWYYFDIAAAAEYNLNLTTLNDIVYTTDGTILIENEATVTDHFSDTEQIQLAAGRYYVKSASEQTLKVEPFAFVYEIGDAVTSPADGEYIQSSTILVTFPDATSNDPDAVLELDEGAYATVNGNPVELVAAEGGFTIDLGTLTENTEYNISISPDVFGYLEHIANDDVNFTVKTPVVFDGEYVLYDSANKLFLGRGNAWGTEASADKYGIPFNLKTDSKGVSSIEFVDWKNIYLFITGTSIFTDNASTGWTLTPTDGGYYLQNADKSAYTSHSSGDYGEYVHIVTDASAATVWSLIKKADRDEIISKYPEENILNVAEAAAIEIATAEEFTSYLDENYNAVDYTEKVKTAKFAGEVGDWAWSGVRGQDGQPAYGTNFAEIWNATGKYTQTIAASELPAGVYKLTVDGYERRSTVTNSNALGEAGYNLVSSYLAANNEQVRLTDWYNTTSKPGNTGGAVTAFENGEATNEVYVYLDGNTDLTITLAKPNYEWDCWTIFNNFTLTYYDQSSANMTIVASAQYGTFVAPFDVTIPEGVTAYTVDAVATNGELTLTALETTIPANTPVVVYSEAADGVNETFYGKENAAEDVTEGLLTGVYEETVVEPGNYVLQLLNGKAAFYKVSADTDEVKVGANRAYLTKPAGTADSGIKAFFFGAGDDTPTGINAIDALRNGAAEIYNAAGVKMPALQKGVNIIRTADGKTQKVLIK